jgi:dTDP-4-dehydrorhamnose 3,5-epimerase
VHRSQHFDKLLAAACQDEPTVTDQGAVLRPLTHGVVIRPLVAHIDTRGSVTELIDERWGYPDPIRSAYTFTIRPNVVKGWSLHRNHQDRYALMAGEIELVLYDPRPVSPTFGQVCKILLSEQHRCLVNVPVDVWHADHNIGGKDALVVNFPTQLYDHAKPDKYRLPIDTDLIPHSFGPAATGW